jgi:hypothetical protein
MGRVAKYKKIKSFDPYSKQNKGSFDAANGVIWGLGDNGRKAKKRSRTAERLQQQKKNKKNTKLQEDNVDGFDLPPSEKDEFDMTDLMGSVKKEKVQRITEEQEEADKKKKESTGTSSSSPPPQKNVTAHNHNPLANFPPSTGHHNDDEQLKVAKLLKLDQQLLLTANADNNDNKVKATTSKTMDRMPGESKRAYQKRCRDETRQIIYKTTTTMKKNVEKLQRKKDFLKQKKKKKKGNKNIGAASVGQYDNDSDDDDDDYRQVASSSNTTFLTGERAVAAMAAAAGAAPSAKKKTAHDNPVRFGEQAERPPVFRQLPRGAQPKKISHNNNNNNNNNPGLLSSPEQIITAESTNAMEHLRRKVQAQYARVRAQRKAAGEQFHL